jgi:winged helix DNA-binding protein
MGLNRSEIARRRMHNQRLWGPLFLAPEEVVQWLTAMQAQEFSFAKWSVAQRADRVSEAAMDRAFAEGAILRTHVLRPTWHFVAPSDIGWLLDLTAPRVHQSNAHYYGRFGLDAPLFAKTNALLAKTVEGGAHRTRTELAAVLDRAGITASGPRLAYIIMHAELDAILCSGPPRGKQHTYAALEERAPDTKTLGREEALAELVSRYFVARGPATLRDFQGWSSLTSADARMGLEAVQSQLDHEVVDGRTYWFAAGSPPQRRRSKRVDLVQGYDETVMSYSESRDALYGGRSSAPVPHVENALMHAVLQDGQLIGLWRPVRTKDAVVVEASLFGPPERADERALEAAVERFGRFLGVPANLVAKSISYGTRPAKRRS